METNSTLASQRTVEGACLAPGTGRGLLIGVDEIVPLFGSSELGAAGETALSELDRYTLAVEALDRSLRHEIGRLQRDDMTPAGSILQAHHCMLHDPELSERARKAIVRDGARARDAVTVTFETAARRLSESGDQFFSLRAADVRELGRRLVAVMDPATPSEAGPRQSQAERLVVADELFVSWVLNAQENHVRGFVVREGTALSHAVILARALGIPVMKIPGDRQEGLTLNLPAAVNVRPNATVLTLNPGDKTTGQDAADSNVPAASRRDTVKGVWLNLIDPSQAFAVADPTVAGVGLFRTEYFFMKSIRDFPGERQQYDYYKQVFDACGEKAVTIRTIDVGGDKELSYFSVGPQENPYLGLRGHRIYRYHPDIFITQIRAILRAGHTVGHLRVLYPMIECVDELLRLKKLFAQAVQSLRDDGLPFNEQAEQGLMIEVPSTAWAARRFLKHVDFACVGTNDLLQYFFAVDRNNANVLDYCRPEDPSALAMLRNIVGAARALKKPLTLCGEIASDTFYLPMLVGLGFGMLSVDTHAVDEVADVLNTLSTRECRGLVKGCMNADTAEEARRALVRFWEERGQSFEKPARGQQGKHVDPVCGMHLSTVDHHLTAVANGKRYYFCTPRCLRAFRADVHHGATSTTQAVRDKG